MTQTGGNGRLGNQIIRNLAVSLLAEKHDLSVTYYNKDLINKLGIQFFNGSKIHSSTQMLSDDNYFTVYHSDLITFNLDPNQHYFQTKEICNILYQYLHSEPVQSNIISHNPFKDRYQNNNDLFVHIRLTDAAHFNPGISYYINAINQVNFDKLYISTDDAHHPIVSNLLMLFPSANLILYDEISTFQFASTCKHIILSHGSFSAVIGYLSFYSIIYYPEYESHKIWYGDMFSIPNWNQLKIHG